MQIHVVLLLTNNDPVSSNSISLSDETLNLFEFITIPSLRLGAETEPLILLRVLRKRKNKINNTTLYLLSIECVTQ